MGYEIQIRETLLTAEIFFWNFWKFNQMGLKSPLSSDTRGSSHKSGLGSFRLYVRKNFSLCLFGRSPRKSLQTQKSLIFSYFILILSYSFLPCNGNGGYWQIISFKSSSLVVQFLGLFFLPKQGLGRKMGQEFMEIDRGEKYYSSSLLMP